MRLGQPVLWNSLTPGSTKVCRGVVRCFEADRAGFAMVECEPDGKWLPISRKRLRIAQPPAKFTAKGGGDSPISTAAALAA